MRAREFINQGVTEGLNEVSKDWRERSRATDEIAKIVLDKKGNYTLDDIKKIKALVQITGRAATVASGSGRDYNKLGTAGGIFDRALQNYREAQAKAGNMPEFTSSATTAKDMANQIALNTNGAYKYRYPRTWISGGTGQRYKDPSDHVVYADKQSYDDAWAWIESKGKKVYYYNNFKNLKTAIKIGKFIVEPATITTGAFSSTPNTTHAISVRNASVINQSVRRQADISDQQAAALRDIAATKSQNAMQNIQLILKVLQGEQDIKQIIDNSKKINPQDKAKLDAIIAGAKNFKEPDQDVSESESESIAPPLPKVLYHGGPKPITKFNIPPWGVYFSPHLNHARGYGNVVTSARVDAKKVYLINYDNEIDDDLMDALFAMNYDGEIGGSEKTVEEYIKLLQKQGYDAMQSISDSEMVVVFPGTPIQVLDNKQGVAENKETSVEDLTTAFVDHYKDDPMGMFMHSKSSYLDTIGRAKNFSMNAAKLHKSHQTMSREEFQDSIMKHFVPHLMKHGFPKHASEGWGAAEHDFMKSLTQDVKEGVAEGTVDEMALQTYKTMGDFSKPGPFTGADKKLVPHPKNIEKATRFFEQTPFDFRLFFSHLKGTGKYSEHGPMSHDQIRQVFGQDAEEIINGSEDAITVVYVGNKGDAKVMLTPWMMAHRFGHAIQAGSRYQNWHTWKEAENYFFQTVNSLLADHYGKIPTTKPPDRNILYQNILFQLTPEYNALFNAIGTQRSSKTGQIRRPYEFLYELFAQYLSTGKVTLNPLPTNLGYGRRVFGNPTKYMNIKPEYRDEGERKQAADSLAYTMELLFNDVLGDSVGKIFVM